ncbi:MAG: glycosyltransferase family 4 protein [Candidatus Krumholzibacteriota bacterium]|nr:glycosyltransferase family 4 protein [Candidatus Krumholzibacteriota bacterium]
MKIIALTNLFPDLSRPDFAPFNRQQFIHLAARNDLRVIVPLPWPLRLRMSLAGNSPRPPDECQGIMRVIYPTKYYTPKFLRRLYGTFYYWSVRPTLKREVARRRPDLIYATWAYPDCYAAVRAGKALGIPVVSRLHGSDINAFFSSPDRKRRILEAMRGSSSIISVSGDLKERLVAEGIAAEKIEVVYNGVDGAIFRPGDKRAARDSLRLSPEVPIILFAGNLKPEKGVGYLINAFAALERKDAQLHILGLGPQRNRLERQAAERGLQDRVIFHGGVSHRLMGQWFNGCDLFCLPSLHEGTPNVILEALACAVPVIAADTGGIPEIVDPRGSILFPSADSGALTRALREGLERKWNRDEIRSPAGSWKENARRVEEVFSRAVAAFPGKGGVIP